MGVLRTNELAGVNPLTFATIPLLYPLNYAITANMDRVARAKKARTLRAILRSELSNKERFESGAQWLERERLLRQASEVRESADATARLLQRRDLSEAQAKLLDVALAKIEAYDAILNPEDLTPPSADEVRGLIDLYWAVDTELKQQQRGMGQMRYRGLGISAEKLLPVFAPWTTITDYQKGQTAAKAQAHQQSIENQRLLAAQQEAARKRLADVRATWDADFDRITAAAADLTDVLNAAQALYSSAGLQPDRSGDLANYAATRDQVLVAIAQKTASLPADPDQIESARSMLKAAQFVIDDTGRNTRAILDAGRAQLAREQAQAAAFARSQAEAQASYDEQQRQGGIAAQAAAASQRARERMELQRLREQIAAERASLAIEKQQLAFRRTMMSSMRGW